MKYLDQLIFKLGSLPKQKRDSILLLMSIPYYILFYRMAMFFMSVPDIWPGWLRWLNSLLALLYVVVKLRVILMGGWWWAEDDDSQE